MERIAISRADEITNSYFNFLEIHINDVINGSVDEFLELNQIASQLHVSHQHLTDTIQKNTGNHPCYFYDKMIIDKAKEVLINSDASIATIAHQFTYDPSNFSKFFKKIEGITPGQFRKQSQKVPKSSP